MTRNIFDELHDTVKSTHMCVRSFTADKVQWRFEIDIPTFPPALPLSPLLPYRTGHCQPWTASDSIVLKKRNEPEMVQRKDSVAVVDIIQRAGRGGGRSVIR